MRPLPFLLTVLLCLPVLAGRAQLSLEPAPGFFQTDQDVRVAGAAAGATYFTTDGSTPTLRSRRYTGEPIRIGRTAVVRVAVLRDTGRVAEAAGTYLIDEPRSPLLTLSVGIDPWRLFHPRTGWFERGEDPDRPNWETHREHEARVEIFASDGRTLHRGPMSFRLFGGTSRSHPQKSFSLSARKRDGYPRVEAPLFGPDAPDDFRFLVVRNGGSDWGRSYLRDALLTGLLVDPSWDLDKQAARPVRVYLNGRYWGLYHLREKINPRFLADHHPGVDKDSLSLLEHAFTAKHGTTDAYGRLLDYIREHDLSDAGAYAEVGRQMDIDNFQRLQIAQTYFDNRDAGGNIRYWRPDGPGQRFRWILYDVDQGFGLHRDTGWTANTLETFMAADGPAWPNPPWSTLIQRSLLKNPGYRRNFVNRTLDYLHTDFSAEAVTERIDALAAGIEPEMPRHLERWEQREPRWRYHVDQLRRFALYRPRYLREHLRAIFRGGADRAVGLSASLGGYVVLNDNLQVGTDGISGNYFSRYPLHLQAVAEPGFRFTGWEGVDTGKASFDLDLTEAGPYRLRATFEPARHPAADQIIINEVSPRNRVTGDWLELHNRGETTVDLTGWFLIDASDRRYALPPARLRRGAYLVVCEDRERFQRVYPQIPDVVGDLPFGLNRISDRIGLYAADGSYVNAISYQLGETADTVFTYALALPGLDNGRREHWVREASSGTPGTANPEHLQSSVMTRQRFWLRVGVGVALLVLVGAVRVWREA
ncbi:CotH kinase family protein [Lewinella sp. IMCC34183]|uniref:CotH kinase family protein n=1 Tax=Lewinella sp. IMCC34183 TaxID=2248762 RepID=UPI0018E5482D|nr:CotH kinase family protein [Lewinella sp. IMCC34183]